MVELDSGCEQYADWWEVLGDQGELLYRRILAHSHVDEQPFTRSGGPIPVDAGEAIVLRAHMSTGGYGSAWTGTADDGFAVDPRWRPPSGSPDLESTPPLPDACAF